MVFKFVTIAVLASVLAAGQAATLGAPGVSLFSNCELILLEAFRKCFHATRILHHLDLESIDSKNASNCQKEFYSK